MSSVKSSVPFRTKITYSLGQFSWAAKDTSFHYFLFFYYTQFLGLSASLAGLAALLALIADAISDPIIGQVSDNWKGGKWGRRHPFMAAAIIPFPLFLIAIFNPPADLSQNLLFAWYLGNAIIIRTFLTLFTVPHLALGAELSEDYEERTSIATFRNLMGYTGGLSIQVIAWFVLIPSATAAGLVANGYRNIGFVAAALAVTGMVAALLGTRNRIPHLAQTSEAQQARPWYYAFNDVVAMLKNHSARVYLGANLVLVTAVGVSNTMLLHVNNFFYGFSSEQTGIFMLCIFLCLFPAAALAKRFAHRLGKERGVIWLICCMSVIGPIPVMAHLYGLTPPAGTTALLAVVCCFVVLHQSFYIANLNIAGGMVPDIADELALASGMRQEGIINSGMMLAQKMTFGLGAFFAGIAIDFAGFDGVTDISQVTETMLTRLAWVYGPGLMCLSFLVALIYSRYKLSRSRLEDIRRQLNERPISAPSSTS
jgi:GPH family glycoside/pentoside/hexuronide:cation symporter